MSILSKLQNQKVGTLELILIGFYVYFKNFMPILLIFCTILLPFQIILPALTNKPPGLLMLFYFSLWLAGLIYWIAISVITENYIFGRTTSYERVFRKIKTSLFPLFLLNFIFLIKSLFLFLMLIIPGAIYSVNNQYYFLAFILRNRKGGKAFNYSCDIVKNHWWKVFFFSSISGTISVFLPFLFLFFGLFMLKDYLNTIPLILLWRISLILSQIIGIGIGICSIILFLHLEFQENLES